MGDEPGTWDVTGAINTTREEGYWGLRTSNYQNNPLDYDWFSVGTSGDAAPSPGGGGASVEQSVSGAITPTGALTTAVIFASAVSGAMTPAGALSRLVQKSLSAQLTAQGIIQKLTSRSLSGGVTPTGATTKRTAKTAFTGAVTPTGTLDRDVVLQRTVEGAMTPTGSLAKRTLKGLAGTLTSAGAITKRTLKALAGSSTPAGALTKRTSVTLEGSITPTGEPNPASVFLQSVAGTLTSAGSLVATYVAGGGAAVGTFFKKVYSLAWRKVYREDED